tara:strand:- start:605 stop:892 length:288 start_codon:yes stop_codon:yes gene_type:complete
MVSHHLEPCLNIFNELRLTLALPALKNFKTSASSVKSSGYVSFLPRLSKNKGHPFVTAKVRVSVRSPKKQPQGAGSDSYSFNDYRGKGLVEPYGI